MTLPGSYFDELYEANVDPWGFTNRWYEERKRAITLAVLPERRYATAYEPGCSVGVLTLGLAERCDALLASDISAIALREAAARLEGRDHVRFERRRLPAEWPEGQFELVVLSEILYYFNDADLRDVVTRSSAAVAPGGTLVSVHWRPEVADYPQRGDRVQEMLEHQWSSSEKIVHHIEDDFDLAVYVRANERDADSLSVAFKSGLR
jgi:trans-aconitate methyltransferase